MRPAVVVAALGLLTGAQTARAHVHDAVGDREVAKAAAALLVEKPRLKRADCSGFVEAVLARAGALDRGGTAGLWQSAVRDGRVRHAGRGEPAPGDLVFFDGTYDKNRNGRVDDELTHVAVVIGVERDGTVVMAHRSSSRIEELRMNLRAPGVHRAADGRVLNSYLRAPRYGPRDGTRLAGELFRAAALPRRAAPRPAPSRPQEECAFTRRDARAPFGMSLVMPASTRSPWCR